MRISDWSSDVCAADLPHPTAEGNPVKLSNQRARSSAKAAGKFRRPFLFFRSNRPAPRAHPETRKQGDGDRKSVASGKCVSVRVDLGGRRILQKNTTRDPVTTRTDQ